MRGSTQIIALANAFLLINGANAFTSPSVCSVVSPHPPLKKISRRFPSPISRRTKSTQCERVCEDFIFTFRRHFSSLIGDEHNEGASDSPQNTSRVKEGRHKHQLLHKRLEGKNLIAIPRKGGWREIDTGSYSFAHTKGVKNSNLIKRSQKSANLTSSPTGVRSIYSRFPLKPIFAHLALSKNKQKIPSNTAIYVSVADSMVTSVPEQYCDEAGERAAKSTHDKFKLWLPNGSPFADHSSTFESGYHQKPKSTRKNDVFRRGFSNIIDVDKASIVKDECILYGQSQSVNEHTPHTQTQLMLADIGWLKEHEQVVSKERVQKLHDAITEWGAYRLPLMVDSRSGAILDGHHRYAVGQILGLSRLPVVLVDYLNDDSISVDVWPECGFDGLTKEEVIEMSLSDRVYPPKTSKHDFVKSFKPINIPLSILR